MFRVDFEQQEQPEFLSQKIASKCIGGIRYWSSKLKRFHCIIAFKARNKVSLCLLIYSVPGTSGSTKLSGQVASHSAQNAALIPRLCKFSRGTTYQKSIHIDKRCQ
jgi:hypothetical protein